MNGSPSICQTGHFELYTAVLHRQQYSSCALCLRAHSVLGPHSFILYTADLAVKNDINLHAAALKTLGCTYTA